MATPRSRTLDKPAFSLSTKVTAVLVSITIVCICSLAGYIVYFRSQLITNSNNELAQILRQQVTDTVTQKLNILLSNAIMMTHNDRLIAALVADDAAFCERQINQVIEEFKVANFQGTRFHIIRANLTSFYRSYSPERNDDISFRDIVKQVAKTRKPLAGVELGRDGIALRALAPVVNDSGHLIGIVEVMFGVGSISRDFRAHENFYILLVDPAALTDATQFRAKNSDTVIGGRYLTANKQWFDEDTVTFARGADYAQLTKKWLQLTDDYFFAATPAFTTSGKLYGIHVMGMSRAHYDSYLAPVFTGATYLLLGMAVLMFVMMSIVIWLLRHFVIQPINALSHFLLGIGNDVTRRFYWQSRDEIGLVSQHLNTLLTRVHQLLAQVQRETHGVVAAAETLQRTSERLHQNATDTLQQSANIAAASAQLNTSGHAIARNCSIAADGAQRAEGSTQHGFEAVQKTVAGIQRRRSGMRKNADLMNSLTERARQIDGIVATIEEIADQTNLLALNAAIEAARAGEMGRGFAVVADEVRALAIRTTQATKEISHMVAGIQDETETAMNSLDTSAHDAEQGAKQAEHMETMLKETLLLVETVTQQISQIATAAEQQTAVTTDSMQRLNRATHATENTVNTVQELKKSATHLHTLSGKLNHVLAQFVFN